MDKGYFMNAGIPPPQPLQFESTMPIPWSNDHPFFNPNPTMDHHHFPQFDSTWNSIASGTATPAEFPKLNLSNFAALTPPVLSTDPGFVERAAKFSCLGSRSFNGRSNSNPPLPRVSSTPLLKQNPIQQQMEIRAVSDKKFGKLSGPATNSNEESSVSEQVPSSETGSMNSRKRKAISRGKTNDERLNSPQRVEGDDDGNSKQTKKETKSEEDEKNKTNQKPPEPPKDYIHVRARRGQATDSHSLAERVRREKISERMKLLQDLVPGCNKVTGKALMLDEIINYVQSLQRQVEFLSMKLASVNPGLDFNVESLLSKNMFQKNTMYPLDSSAPAFYNQQNVQQQQLYSTNISSGPLSLSQCSVDPLHFDGFNQNITQFPAFTEDDLHSIVHMGFVQNSVQNQNSNMKVEL